MSDKDLTYTPFDPNLDASTVKSDNSNYGAVFPSVPREYGPVTSASQYADIFTKAIQGNDSLENFLEGMAKAIQRAPVMDKFAKLDLMPQQYSDSLVNWPGIPPELLTKLSDDAIFMKTIIQGRVADVLRYSGKSSHPWKPGFSIILRSGFTAPTEDQKKRIEDAENFILNCAYGTVNARQRDKLGYRPFRNFLAAFVRDRFRYDFVTVYTDCDVRDQVQAFKVFPAACVRLATPRGYKGDPNIFAVGLDNGYQVVEHFTRKQLFTVVQNERSDPDWGPGYGYPELEQGMTLLKGLTDVWELLTSVFSKSAIPNGILMAEGMWGPRQLEILTAIWKNLKTGVSKGHALPVMAMPKDGGLKILDLQGMKESAAYFEPFVNLASGLFASLCNFPVERLGYKTSGSGTDNKPDKDTTSGTIVDTADPGLYPLLEHIATAINEYILWTRWPDLQFVFRGANPKEDSREYEARMRASTWGEARALSDLLPIESLAKGKEQKELMSYMELCPVDSVAAAVFQNLVTATIAAKNEKETAGSPEKAQGATKTEKIDPAKSETHGGTSGVARDSAKEKKKSLAPVYVSRPVMNAYDIYNWAEENGILNIVPPEEMHVTIVYSKEAVDWDSLGDSVESITVKKGFRALDYFGPDGTALVLKFSNTTLTGRQNQLLEKGCSSDWPSYQPHITISKGSSNIDLTAFEPYKGVIELGEEVFAPLEIEEPAENIDERTQARYP